MSASNHVDAVDLVEREAPDRLKEVPSIGRGWSRYAETLGGESDPSRCPERYPLFPHPGGR